MQTESSQENTETTPPELYIAGWLKEFINETVSVFDQEAMSLVNRHGFALDPADLMQLIADPEVISLGSLMQSTVNDQQYLEKLLGEYYAKLHKITGVLASVLLMRSQWRHGMSEWFDHRQHLFCPEEHFNDYWTMSADNVLRVLPLEGRLLDLCSGDGFYAYYYFRRRTRDITCVELDRDAFRHAVHFHSDAGIRYINQDVLTYQPESNSYDVVVLRGAIEHFDEVQQFALFNKVWTSLKPGGWFCGDTVANTRPDKKRMLPSHCNEWSDEQEMRSAFKDFFKEIKTFTLESRTRTTLFWQCRKTPE